MDDEVTPSRLPTEENIAPRSERGPGSDLRGATTEETLDLARPRDAGESAPDGPARTGRFNPPAAETTDLVRAESPLDTAGAGADGAPPDRSTRIGRYRVVRVLGRGGFGRVYLAQDDELGRPVAVKVPNPERIAGPEDVEVYLAEARALARLEHPHIVPVHDVGRTPDGLCYVVSRYVQGCDLAERMRQGPLSFVEAAELAAAVAEALHHAHSRGLVHRDIKPANILIDTAGKPCVADFGLALHEEDFGKEAGLAGTPSYMSPEQARGEGHRVDGRSDIFSLGTVLYELLSGRRPFRGDTHTEVLRQVIAAEPRPLRQLDDSIPKELERICLKALSRRAAERYPTAADMADDLRHFIRTETTRPLTAFSGAVSPASGPGQEAATVATAPGRPDPSGLAPRVVPKGLRSFDRNDADFFLELLPGARDRDGLPESVRFWKSRIEMLDGDATFKVGVIYGPSGCGKSSMVKAGLLPRLDRNILSVYVEATPTETEARLLRGLHKVCPDLPADRDLVETVAALRRGRALRAGQKVLLVLDQFEQWLFAHDGAAETGLVAALRHCDGEHVQAVVMVRDDFWMAATRFLHELEVRLLEGENAAAVDLFDPLHARKVLAGFGRAFGVLPERPAELTSEQQAFLDHSVAGLAQDGKVISVRLALFAEMVKGKPWVSATLKEVGGTEGVGVTFLEETFSASTAPPEHRLHQRAARAVLKALLPQAGSDIKGQMRSEAELREVSGYAGRPRDFEDLVRILDPELRLITPTDPEGTTGEVPSTTTAQPGHYYQLTHDYLVPSLREWLTRKQRETRRGRAELQLAERTALWEVKPENRVLPSLQEWASIRTLTRPKDWTGPQRRMMKRAGRYHGLRALGLAALIAGLAWGGIEGYGHVRSAGLVESVRAAGTTDVPVLIKQLDGFRRWTDPRLRQMLGESSQSSRDHLHASLALLPVDPAQADYLGKRLLRATPAELPVLRSALAAHRSRLTPMLWTELEKARPGDPSLLASAGALVLYDRDGSRWSELGGKVAEALVKVNPVFLGSWLDAVRPVRVRLAAPLETVFVDKGRPETEHVLATNILADYAADDPDRLARLLMAADPKAYQTFFPTAERQATSTVSALQAEFARLQAVHPTDAETEPVKDERAERQARAAVALVRLGQADAVWPLLRHSADPRLRSFIINWLEPLGAGPKAVVAEFDRLQSFSTHHSSPTTQTMDAILFDQETSTRRALIQALGTYGTDGLSPDDRAPLTTQLLRLYEHDPDAGIHGASAWTLRQWKQHERLKAIDARLKGKVRGDRRWFVNGQGQTFAIVEGPLEFRIGSPLNEPGRRNDYEPHAEKIDYRLAIAIEEVGMQDYLRFARSDKKYKPFDVPKEALDRFTTPDGPMIAISWYGAAAYCNWLSEQEKIPRDQWCYEPNDKGDYAEGMTIKKDVMKLAGYRLPTELEWEYACRAGTLTSRYYGFSDALLEKYARYQANSDLHAWPRGSLLPNDLGLFDTLGNLLEWTQDKYDDNVRVSVIKVQGFESISDQSRVVRSGTFSYPPPGVRAAERNWGQPATHGASDGLRLARTYR